MVHLNDVVVLDVGANQIIAKDVKPLLGLVGVGDGDGRASGTIATIDRNNG